MERIGVIGGGLTGSGIAEVTARAALEVVLAEMTGEAVEAAKDRIRGSLERAVSHFKEPSYSPTPLLDRMVDAGLLGKNSEHGFYAHA